MVRTPTSFNPNVETAYRYYADMLRNRATGQAAVHAESMQSFAEPYNRVFCVELHAWATLIHEYAYQRGLLGLPAPKKMILSPALKAGPSRPRMPQPWGILAGCESRLAK